MEKNFHLYTQWTKSYKYLIANSSHLRFICLRYLLYKACSALDQSWTMSSWKIYVFDQRLLSFFNSYSIQVLMEKQENLLYWQMLAIEGINCRGYG